MLKPLANEKKAKCYWFATTRVQRVLNEYLNSNTGFVFIYLQKVHDNVSGKRLWIALQMAGIDEALSKIIRYVYRDNMPNKDEN